MKLVQRILSNIIFFIQVLLIFLLLFQQKMVLPAWLQSVGRMHPLLLHLPIGFLLLAGLLWLFRKNFDTNTFHTIFSFALHLTAFAASAAALMGFFLSCEEGYEPGLLSLHQWTGVGVSFLACILLLLYQYSPGRRLLISTTMLCSIILLIVAGHYGATLTHGEGYVWQPLRGDEIEDDIITDSTDLFTAAVKPVLKAKCFSCHNERKAKGELVMTSVEKLLKGGKEGPIWIPGDPLNSHIIQAAQLPLENKKHMPPEGKAQLTPEEIALLHAWIQSGADMKKALKDYDAGDTLHMLAARFIKTKEQETVSPQYSFAAASPATVEKLNDPFLALYPLAQNSPALQADFYIRQKFDRKKLEALSAVKEQLVSLNLSNMPVKDEDMKIISKFVNLEKLILNNTDVTGKTLADLHKLSKLRSLSLAGTKVDKSISSALSLFPALKEVFTWNTAIKPEEIAALQSQIKTVKVVYGFVPDNKEILKLTPPILVNENTVLNGNENILLKHHLPGVAIRYSLDGSVPDSNASTVYKDAISINQFTVIRARAVKEGWYSSEPVDYYFFKKGIQPATAELINPTNELYKGNGALSLTDGVKGDINNFRDAAWLGFREKPFAAYFYFDNLPAPLSNMTLSFGKNVDSYIMPPMKVEVWGGNDKSSMKLLKSVLPEQPVKTEPGKIAGLNVSFTPSQYKCYKVVAIPVAKLPAWHQGKGDKGWVFVDEVFFN